MTYTRIAYGAQCTWFGPIHKVSKESTCPHCHGVLFETSDIKEWNKLLDSVSKTKQPKYNEAIRWQEANDIPCSKTIAELRGKYVSHLSHSWADEVVKGRKGGDT